MTDKTQPEALRLADWLDADACDLQTPRKAAAELRRQHTRIAELEAELEAVGAGGVQALQPEGGPPGSGGWQHHAETMERERDHWRERARTMEEHQRGTVWYWQGDGNDHPESMVNSLPVVIRADQLRALIAGGVQALSAAPGAVSDTQHSQFLSDVLTAAGLITHGKQCKALGERLADMVMRLRAAPQQKAQEPALFVSAKQLADLVDPSHATGGSYLPARKTRAGLFTQPLYTAPQPAPAPLSFDACDMATAAAQGFRSGQAAAKQEE